jgi:hypothetical protein
MEGGKGREEEGRGGGRREVAKILPDPGGNRPRIKSLAMIQYTVHLHARTRSGEAAHPLCRDQDQPIHSAGIRIITNWNMSKKWIFTCSKGVGEKRMPEQKKGEKSEDI